VIAKPYQPTGEKREPSRTERRGEENEANDRLGRSRARTLTFCPASIQIRYLCVRPGQGRSQQLTDDTPTEGRQKIPFSGFDRCARAREMGVQEGHRSAPSPSGAGKCTGKGQRKTQLAGFRTGGSSRAGASGLRNASYRAHRELRDGARLGDIPPARRASFAMCSAS
jgi:hypothetical protein